MKTKEKKEAYRKKITKIINLRYKEIEERIYGIQLLSELSAAEEAEKIKILAQKIQREEGE